MRREAARWIAPKHLRFCMLRDRHQQLMQDLRDRAEAREVILTRLAAHMEAARVGAAYSRMLLSLPVWGPSDIRRTSPSGRFLRLQSALWINRNVTRTSVNTFN